MSLTQRLREYISAAFTGIWIQSFEHDDAIAEIAGLCRDQKWALAIWDLDRGLQTDAEAVPAATDPVAAVHAVAALARPGGTALMVLINFHRLLGSSEVMQALAHQLHRGKQERTFVLILSAVVQIPPELQRQFIVIEHDLPDRQQLLAIARGVATDAGEMPQEGEELQRLLDAAAGLTRHEAEGAFALSLVRGRLLSPASVWDLKTAALKKSGLLTLHRGGERFADLGGLNALKGFCTKAIASGSCVATTDTTRRKVKARGVLLLGVPGTGKSAFAKSLGVETGRPTLLLDVGTLMGGLVGQTEQNVRQALRLADSMAPCILFIDELEKGLAGASSSGSTDSGVGARLFGSLLTWLSDHESDVYLVATANDVSRLPPEFSRAERCDAIYFLDLPGSSQKQQIWEIVLKEFALPPDQVRPRDADWTGAEIRACCRLSALLDVPLTEAARHVVPVAVTAAESVERLRTWAAGRCLDAEIGGLYARRAKADAVHLTGHRVTRPSTN